MHANINISRPLNHNLLQLPYISIEHKASFIVLEGVSRGLNYMVLWNVHSANN